ncbi:adenylate/guanylate cyclase domain-containing protein [Roseibium salinum]|nr:adenylate/guanylate cyclase domain-containing protein [Roseibium salinum]
MFVDLRNFTRITESQLAYDVVHLLNRYLDQASAAIHAEGGHVDKFIGDGIMAIFGMKVDAKTGARQALRACRRIEEVMKALEAEKGAAVPRPDPPRDRTASGARHSRDESAPPAPRANGAASRRLAMWSTRPAGWRRKNKAHNSFLAVSKAVIDLAEATIPLAEPAEITLRGKEIPLQIYTVVSLAGLFVPDDQAVSAT